MRFTILRFVGIAIIVGLIMAGCAASPASSDAISSGAAPKNTSLPTTAAPGSAAAPTDAAPPAAPSATGVPVTGAATGGIRCVMTPGLSEASYSVREQLARLSFPTDAVGKTNQVSGEINISKEGTIDTSNSKFVVDLTTLQTDSAMRDNFVRRNVLQTNQYPQAVFVPTQVSGLPTPLPPSGNVSFKLSGDMTLHGVTKPVTWDVTGTAQNGSASGTATTSFKFEDFNLQQPQVPIVLSVADNITLQVTVQLQTGN